MKIFIMIFAAVLLGLLMSVGCGKTGNDSENNAECGAEEPVMTVEIGQPAHGRAVLYEVPVGDASQEEAETRCGELMGRYTEEAMYEVLAEAVGTDVHDKIKVERMEAVEREYKVSIPVVLADTPDDHFQWPEGADLQISAVMSQTYQLYYPYYKNLSALANLLIGSAINKVNH